MDPSQASARPPTGRQTTGHAGTAHHAELGSAAGDSGEKVPLVAVRGTPATCFELMEQVWAQGAAVLPVDASLSEQAAVDSATALGATALVDDTRSRALDDDAGWRALVPAGTALVVRTSGSTGQPRGVVLSHEALQASVAASIDRLDARAAQWLGVLPMHHVAGVLVALRARAANIEPSTLPRFGVAAVAAALDGPHAPTHIAVVPTMLHRLLDGGVDVARFARILLGGAAPPAGLLERATDAGAVVTVSYGMTETCGGCVYDGVPLDGVAVAVDPDERVLLRGPVLADGYVAGDTVEPVVDGDGWLRTSDLGRFVDGRLTLLGRADDVIITGGVNVPASTIADLVRSHPAVKDTAVIGLDDAEWGQRVVAVVVPIDAGDPPTEDDIRTHVRARSTAPMTPRQVRVVSGLPRTSLGKIDRAAVRAEFDRSNR